MGDRDRRILHGKSNVNFGVAHRFFANDFGMHLQPRKPFDTSLTCRVTTIDALPMPTRPHTLCDGKNVVFDTQHCKSINCLVHRYVVILASNCVEPMKLNEIGCSCISFSLLCVLDRSGCAVAQTRILPSLLAPC